MGLDGRVALQYATAQTHPRTGTAWRRPSSRTSKFIAALGRSEGIRRLVRDYVLRDGLTEDRALDKVRQYAHTAHGRGCPAGRIA